MSESRDGPFILLGRGCRDRAAPRELCLSCPPFLPEQCLAQGRYSDAFGWKKETLEPRQSWTIESVARFLRASGLPQPALPCDWETSSPPVQGHVGHKDRSMWLCGARECVSVCMCVCGLFGGGHILPSVCSCIQAEGMGVHVALKGSALQWNMGLNVCVWVSGGRERGRIEPEAALAVT